MNRSLTFTIIFALCSTTAMATLPVRINEFMYNPPTGMGADSDMEWVELYNPSSISVDLSGWTLVCGGRTTDLVGTIGSDSYLVVARELFDGPDIDTDCFYCYYDNTIPAIDGASWSLSNTEGDISICNPSGACDTVHYLDDLGGDGDGSSLEFTVSGWQPSTDTDAVFQAGKPDGTPGHRNSNEAAPEIPEFSSLAAIGALAGLYVYWKKAR